MEAAPKGRNQEVTMNNIAKRFAMLIVGTGLCTLGLVAQSQPQPATTVTPRREAKVEKRAARQEKRIAQGVATGQLTPKEAARAERKQAHIQRDIAKAEADGKITRKEATRIEHEQNKASRQIRREKHDAQHR